jgi:hypothetical protein
VQMRHGVSDPTFSDGLSGSQHNSFRLLSEWWMGSIQEDFLSQAAQRALRNAGDSSNAHSQYLDVDRKLARLTESTYHKEMFMLFQLEFVHEMRLLQTREHKTFLGFVQGQRERCAQYASLQRVAHSFLRNEVTVAERHSASFGVGPAPLREIPLSPSLLSQNIPACIESCPWLRIRESAERLPYYLWDVMQKKTVKTEDLQSKVTYVCVSHTWGRYREKEKPAIKVPGVPWMIPRNSKFEVDTLPEQLVTAFGTGYVWFDLLCIPQDRSERALIEISRQAAIFGNAVSVVAWLNDALSWNGLRTVAKWLSLFYLHTSVAVDGGYYNVLELPEDSDEFDDDAIELYLWDPEYLPGQTQEGQDNADIAAPVPWFTSLWTLQETCLRPDMVLCNRNWEPLKAGPQTVIPLDHVVALNNYVARGTYRKGLPKEEVNIELGSYRKALSTGEGSVQAAGAVDPTSVQRVQYSAGSLKELGAVEPDLLPGCMDLSTLLTDTCMSDLNWVSPAAVFTFGQLRQCSESRAEAIMSVVGAVDWYKSYLSLHGTAPPENDLVLGLYPATFLNEAVAQVGPTFFTAIPTDLRYLLDAVSVNNDSWELNSEAGHVGSMLPFTKSPTYLVPPQKYSFGAYNHPSVQHWQISQDASVCISKAGIVTPQQLENEPSGEPDMIIVPLPDEYDNLSLDSEIETVDGDLREWLQTFSGPTDSPNYAVCLYQQIYLNREIPGPMVGLLLKQVKADDKRITLVKIGQFFTKSASAWDITTVDVDWVVL